MLKRVVSFLKKDNGDTNFISIIIILGIVIVLAGVFIAFREQIVGVITDVVNGFNQGSLGTPGAVPAS